MDTVECAGIEKTLNVIGQGADTGVADELRASAMAGGGGCNDVVVAGNQRDDISPYAAGHRHAVQEHKGPFDGHEGVFTAEPRADVRRR
jgi:hypothetical protein